MDKWGRVGMGPYGPSFALVHICLVHHAGASVDERGWAWAQTNKAEQVHIPPPSPAFTLALALASDGLE